MENKFNWDNVKNIKTALSKMDKVLEEKIKAIDSLDFDTIEKCQEEEKELLKYIKNENRDSN